MASLGGGGDDAEDEEVLRAIEAAEAAAVASASKRRRLPSPPPAAEGSYMAALKGSHSSLWKQQKDLTHKRSDGPKTLAASGGGGQAARGACFKCGESGHWARDCPSQVASSASTAAAGGGGSGSGRGGREVAAGAVVEEKACPCGAGGCVVFTSTTAKNPGRKFYRCPMRDNGGCNFFEWCDTPSSGFPNVRNDSVYQSNASGADMLCPCGAGTCLVLTAKTGKNMGRQFYRCPANQGGSSCGFFKWCDEQGTGATARQPASQKYQIDVTSNSQVSSERSYSSCFKCGQEGHWAKDCPDQSSDPYTNQGGRNLTSSGSSGACFKCGKAGHWSRDCPAQNCGAGAAPGRIKSSSASSSQKSHGY